MVASVSALAAALLIINPSTDAFAPSITRKYDTSLFGSGGMDAYAQQMAALSAGASASPPPPFQPVAPVQPMEQQQLQPPLPQPATAVPSPAAPVSINGDASPSHAINTLSTSQQQTLSQIASSIPDLAPKPDLSYDASSGFTIGGNLVSLDARDAPGPANVAWLSSLCIDNTLSSLTIYNGPLTDVPHLVSRCAIVNGGANMHLYLDFRPRAYGAYDLRDADGNYPGPDTLGRKSFEYSGARKEYDTKFGNEGIVSFLEEAMRSFEGGVRVGEDMTVLGELERLTRGPLALEVIMPLRCVC